MRLINIIFLLLCLTGWPLAALKAQSAAETPGAAAKAEPGEEGLPTAAPDVYHNGFFHISNSMLVTWIVAIAIIIFAQYATRQMKDVPEGAQNFLEFLVESLHDFLEEIVGADLIKKAFWFF
ncbi:MAG TPA: hypothetical protein VK731_11795, partial [Candidatus Cybelea sp.]|nr:hypothetical protein [Candidatus Cybelea sp.]